MKRAQMTPHARFLFDEKRKKREAKQKQFDEESARRTRRHEIRMAQMGAQLRSEKYEGPEYSTSIPDVRTTVASLTRAGFQSPRSSPPTTPKKTRTQVNPQTPIPLALPKNPEGTQKVSSRTRRGYRKTLEATKARRKAGRPEDAPGTLSDSESEAKVQESESSVESATESSVEETKKQKKNRLRIEKLLAKRAAEIARKKARARGLRTRSVGVSRIRGRINVAAMRSARAKQKKTRQEFKRERVNKRHKLTGHHPMVPKLQIRQKGPGQFSVRSTGVTPQIENHVKSLLSRLKGKLFVNGKFTAPKRAFSVIMALLRAKQVIEIQIR